MSVIATIACAASLTFLGLLASESVAFAASDAGSTNSDGNVRIDAKPNVVMICVDDLNDWVGYLSREPTPDLLDLLVEDPVKRKRLKNYLTPNIDRLAESGVAFTKAYCNSPLCGPSRASFLTGLHPSTTGYYLHSTHFRDSVKDAHQLVTLPQHLKQQGYLTIEAGKVFHKSRGGQANVPSPSHSDPQSWSAQHIQWGGTAWTFKPLSRDGKHYSGNPWQYDPDTTAAEFEKYRHQPELAQLPMSDRWHAGRIKLNYFSKFFYWGVLPAPGNTQYNSRDWHTLETTFDYQQADYVASFLSGATLAESKKFRTDISPLASTAIDGFPRRENGQPFFIAYGGRLPHDPFIVPECYANGLNEIISIDELNIKALDRLNESISGDPRDLEDSEIGRFGNRLAALANLHNIVTETGEDFAGDKYHYWRQALFMYMASIKFSDDCVGRVLDGLDASPEKDNTIVVMLSDHGWHLGSKKHWSKLTLWEESAHIPFIIKAPGIKAAKCERPVDLLSIYSTILDLTDLPAPHDLDPNAQILDSKSIVPLLNDPGQTWNHPILISHKDSDEMECFAAVDDRWKLIHYCFNGEEEMYDLTNDPFEQRNLIRRKHAADTETKLAYHRLRTSILNKTKNAPKTMLTIKESSPAAFELVVPREPTKPLASAVVDKPKRIAQRRLADSPSTPESKSWLASWLANSLEHDYGPSVFSLLVAMIMLVAATSLANFEFRETA